VRSALAPGRADEQVKAVTKTDGNDQPIDISLADHVQAASEQRPSRKSLHPQFSLLPLAHSLFAGRSDSSATAASRLINVRQLRIVTGV
jgi:hypothetical protein